MSKLYEHLEVRKKSYLPLLQETWKNKNSDTCSLWLLWITCVIFYWRKNWKRLECSPENIIIAITACNQNLCIDLVSLFQVVITSKKYLAWSYIHNATICHQTLIILQILLVVIKCAVSESHLGWTTRFACCSPKMWQRLHLDDNK